MDCLTDPATVAAEKVANYIEQCVSLLNAAVRSPDVAEALFDAVVAIQRGCRDRAATGPITPQQRHSLLTASVSARSGAAEHLPLDYERRRLNVGMAAVAYQIAMWAESREKTARRDTDDVLDFNDGVSILRNELENISLQEKMAERVRRRARLGVCAAAAQGGGD